MFSTGTGSKVFFVFITSISQKMYFQPFSSKQRKKKELHREHTRALNHIYTFSCVLVAAPVHLTASGVANNKCFWILHEATLSDVHSTLQKNRHTVCATVWFPSIFCIFLKNITHQTDVCCLGMWICQTYSVLVKKQDGNENTKTLKAIPSFI